MCDIAKSFTPELKKILDGAGCYFERSGKGDHEIWFNAATNQKTTIPHHGEIKEGTLRSILKQTQIDVDIFLDV